MNKNWLRLPSLILLCVLAASCSKDSETLWGVYQEPVKPSKLPAAAGADELQVLWQRNLGVGADNGYAILKPAYDRDGLYAAARDGGVFKLNPDTGETIWTRNLEAEIFSGVGVGEALAVVALDDGTVIAFTADSGEIKWRAPLGRQISAIPVIGQGRVIARTAGGSVIGLDAETGEVAWSFDRAVPGLSIHGDATPVISGDAVLVGLANGRLAANNVVTGREYWETEVSFARGRNELERLTDSDTSPLVTAATVYAATYQGNVAALRLQNAEAQWRAKLSSRLPMSLGGGNLLVTDDLGAVVAVDADTGEQVWAQEGFRGHGMSRPLVIGSRVVVGDAAGNLYSLKLNDGKLQQKSKMVDGAVVALIPYGERFAAFSSAANLVVMTVKPE